MPTIDPILLPAVFGLIGVIIGGLITGGVTYLIEERRADRDETKERRKRLAYLKQAARLVHEDFVWASASVDFAVESKQWRSLMVDQSDWKCGTSTEASWLRKQRLVIGQH
jgi:hypothetical protein